jgi:hypothetical protein
MREALSHTYNNVGVVIRAMCDGSGWQALTPFAAYRFAGLRREE